MKTHYLKTLPEFFEMAINGSKTFECRYNDRDYEVGDKVVLMEWDLSIMQFTGRELFVEITYVLKDFVGMALNWVVFSIKIVED